MAALVTKFCFDVDMSLKTTNKRVVKEDVLNDLLKNAKEQAYQAGFKAGENSEQSRSAQALLSNSQKLIGIANKIANEREEMHKSVLAQAIDLGAITGKKLASHLINEQPEVELFALIKECLSSLEDVPHLVIHCHPDLAEQCQEVANELMKTSRFSGNLVIMGDPEIAIGDGKIEWVDGGLTRDSKTIMEEIDKAISSFLSANNIEQLNNETKNKTSKEELKEKENG